MMYITHRSVAFVELIEVGHVVFGRNFRNVWRLHLGVLETGPVKGAEPLVLHHCSGYQGAFPAGI